MKPPRPSIDSIFEAERDLRIAAVEYADKHATGSVWAVVAKETARRALRQAARKYSIAVSQAER